MDADRCEACGGELTATSPPGTSPLVLRCQRCGRERFFEVQYAPPPGAPVPEPRRDTSSLPPSAIAALDAGDRILAIKIVREATGLGLQEAKAAVERHARGEPAFDSPARRAGDGDALPLAAVLALRNGKLIEAVKIVRAERGIGLKDAKDVVDRHVASDPLLRSRIEAARTDAWRNVLLWAAALAVLGALVVYVLP